jgi:hypothetical protein
MRHGATLPTNSVTVHESVGSVGVLFTGEINRSQTIANMAFTLWSLFEAALLCLNAVCILHEERFLVKSKYFILLYLHVCIKLI